MASLKGTLNLQCRFDAVAVRMASALLAPLLPLLVLLVCLGIEYFYYGLGINSGLQAGAELLGGDGLSNLFAVILFRVRGHRFRFQYCGPGDFDKACYWTGFFLSCGFGKASLKLSLASQVAFWRCNYSILIELFSGSGFGTDLQALTLFYVGGAFGSSRLLRCQRVDGEGASLKEPFD